MTLRQNFSALTLEIEKVGYDIYLQKQLELGEELLSEFCRTHGNQPVFEELNSFFLSLTQSRRTRAGKTFEETIKGLFRRCDYPFEEQCIINGKPDFLMPSEAHYRKNAPDCIIFTAKRTLRERWRQIATEGVRGKGLFLATLDGGISANQAEEMLANRIYMVVPRTLKQSNPVYQDAPNIISFEDFFTDHLDPAIARWRRAKII
ncbi:MAG: hypothetical protein PCFJNLEI_01541 [Verrucomicrobiae bacterium]|nr:hypothetical protein [Verrucomicrobiae bacterium]